MAVRRLDWVHHQALVQGTTELRRSLPHEVPQNGTTALNWCWEHGRFRIGRGRRRHLRRRTAQGRLVDDNRCPLAQDDQPHRRLPTGPALQHRVLAKRVQAYQRMCQNAAARNQFSIRCQNAESSEHISIIRSIAAVAPRNQTTCQKSGQGVLRWLAEISQGCTILKKAFRQLACESSGRSRQQPPDHTHVPGKVDDQASGDISGLLERCPGRLRGRGPVRASLDQLRLK
mmetsp:Transcript_126607/g.405334  ORF Transcript_126607/g.405334 Transcript_126607/m.405334 type:complete len:230 (+) Transcript_126607:252-941(+)